MKALTLWTPWPWFIAASINGRPVKSIETRASGTSYRGLLAIHVAKKVHPESIDAVAKHAALLAALFTGQNPAPVAAAMTALVPRLLGVVVLTCRLVDCAPMGDPYSFRTGLFEGDAGELPGRHVLVIHDDGTLILDKPGGPNVDVTHEKPYGYFAPGRYGWILEDIEVLPDPIPATGHQGLWDWDPPGR